MALLSVVIPFRDRPELLQRLLGSMESDLKGGDYLHRWDIELLFIDNNSGAEAIRLVKSFADAHTGEADFPFVRIESEPKGGASAARNRGLDLARGAYIYFFDSDDELSLQGVMEAALLAKREKADAVAIRTNIVTPSGSVRAKSFAPTASAHRQIVGNNFATQSLLLNTTFARRHGRWDEGLDYWIDWEWALRILLAKPRLVFFGRTINHIFLHPNSITGSNFASHLSGILKAHSAAEKDIMEAHLSLRERDRLLRALEGRKIIYAAHIYKEWDNIAARRLSDSVRADRLTFAYKIRLRLASILTRRGVRGAWRLI